MKVYVSALGQLIFMAQFIIAAFILRTVAARFSEREGGKALATIVA